MKCISSTAGRLSKISQCDAICRRYSRAVDVHERRPAQDLAVVGDRLSQPEPPSSSQLTLRLDFSSQPELRLISLSQLHCGLFLCRSQSCDMGRSSPRCRSSGWNYRVRQASPHAQSETLRDGPSVAYARAKRRELERPMTGGYVGPDHPFPKGYGRPHNHPIPPHRPFVATAQLARREGQCSAGFRGGDKWDRFCCSSIRTVSSRQKLGPILRWGVTANTQRDRLPGRYLGVAFEPRGERAFARSLG